MVKLGHVSLELREQTDRHVNRNTLHPSGEAGRSKNLLKVVVIVVDTCRNLHLSTVAITDYMQLPVKTSIFKLKENKF